MFQTTARSLYRILPMLAIVVIGWGCSLTELKFISKTPGQYYALVTAVAFLRLPVVPRTTEAAATTPPQLLVGEPAGTGVRAGTGVAYVYEKSITNWSSVDSVFDANAPGRQGFGQSISTVGNDVIVGAPLANSFAGRAFVFAQAGTTWTQQG